MPGAVRGDGLGREVVGEGLVEEGETGLVLGEQAAVPQEIRQEPAPRLLGDGVGPRRLREAEQRRQGIGLRLLAGGPVLCGEAGDDCEEPVDRLLGPAEHRAAVAFECLARLLLDAGHPGGVVTVGEGPDEAPVQVAAVRGQRLVR